MDWLKQLPAVQTLEQTWAQQYRITNGHARRLTPQERPPVGEWLRSPYDRDVRYGRKRNLEWVGYKVHVTEGCDDDRPHLITDVHTAPAIEQDHHALDTIQDHLARRLICSQLSSWSMLATSAPNASCTVARRMRLT